MKLMTNLLPLTQWWVEGGLALFLFGGMVLAFRSVGARWHHAAIMALGVYVSLPLLWLAAVIFLGAFGGR
jgi:hypothetical protein